MGPASSAWALDRLSQRLAERDPAVLSELFDVFSPGVFAVALRVTRNPHAAEDVTQNVFIWNRSRGRIGSAARRSIRMKATKDRMVTAAKLRPSIFAASRASFRRSRTPGCQFSGV